MKPFDIEIIKKYPDHIIMACDEVGRGPLAGDVVASCVAIDLKKLDHNFINDLSIDDSKKLSAKKRSIIIKKLEMKWSLNEMTTLYTHLKDRGILIGVSRISPQEIDQINILQASLKAMADSVNIMTHNHKAHLLIDGNQLLKERVSLDISQQTVIKGDSKSTLIGLASIVAKEFRDHLMDLYDEKHPEFQFRKNSGYPTVAHREAIKKYGILPIHRKSFKGVREYCQNIKED